MYKVTSKIFIARKLRNGLPILEKEVIEYFESIRGQVTEEVRFHMRDGVSAAIGLVSEKESVFTEVIPGRRPRLQSSSKLVQAAVDERGASFGALPPYGPGTPLREWVIGTLHPEPGQLFVTSRGVARAILERGLPSDGLREPFATAFRQLRPMVVEGLRAAAARATVQMKTG